MEMMDQFSGKLLRSNKKTYTPTLLRRSTLSKICGNLQFTQNRLFPQKTEKECVVDYEYLGTLKLDIWGSML
jgi:hypothetical protein